MSIPDVNGGPYTPPPGTSAPGTNSSTHLPPSAPPGSEPVPGLPGYYRTPFGQYGYVSNKPGTDFYGNPTPAGSWVSVPKSYIDAYTGNDPSWHGFAPQEWQDPRYWQMEQDKLAQQYMNSGLDAESARRQAEATLIANRNSNAVNLADTSGKIAAQAAQFAANPRDAVSELMFRNAVGGSTPFGAAQSNPAFPQYQTGLQNKFQELFGGVGGDLSRARDYLSAPPPSEFLSPSYTGPGSENINRNTTLPPQFAEGGTVGVLPKVDLAARSQPGYSPSSTEAGLSMAIHEPSYIVGADSGHVYASLAEPRPNGERRGELVRISPLPSEREKDKKLKDQGKDAVQSMGKGFAEGGSVGVMPDPSDFINQLRQQLSKIGGGGGGVGGFTTQLPDIRLLAGAPANALAQDPDLADYTLAGYSSMGISPRNFQSTLDKFTPRAPVNNLPRISWA